MVSTARLFGLERRQTDRQKNGEMDRGTDGGTEGQTDREIKDSIKFTVIKIREWHQNEKDADESEGLRH